MNPAACIEALSKTQKTIDMATSKNAKAVIVAVIASLQVMATTASAQQEQPVASKVAISFQNKGTSDAVASIKCDSSDSLKELLKKAEEGTVIILKNGTYAVGSLTIDRTGVEIIAETPGDVIFTGPTRIEIKGDKNVIKGIRFDACVGIGRSSLVGIRGNENRITECAFINCNPPAKETYYHWFGIDGLKNRVDHCHFAGQNHAGVTIVYSFDKGPGEHIFDHNYLKDRPKGHTDNGFETLRVGSSEYSHLNGKVTIENNLFENCDGEVEIISLKTSANIVRGNTFRDCFGWVTTRQCESTLIEGNYFFGKPDEEQVGGIRIIGPSHRVVNNYFEGLTANHVLSLRAGNAQRTLGKLYKEGTPAAKGGGVGFVYQVSAKGTRLCYQEVTNVLINQNIIILGENQMAIWYNQSYGDKRESFYVNRYNTISQNIIYRTAGNARLFTNSAPAEIQDSGLSSTTFKDNIAYAVTGTQDPDMSDSNVRGFTFKNPELTRDKYGILRSKTQPDAGPRNPPLTPADVGPAWMKKYIKKKS